MTTKTSDDTIVGETRGQMMERKEQIEALARAWEALEDGRYREEYLDGDGDLRIALVCPLKIVEAKPVGDLIVANFLTEGGHQGSWDSLDATNCLLILRSVYGEDWDIRMGHYDRTIPEPYQWWAFCAGGSNYGKAYVSDISRVDAVRLALEDKDKEEE